MKKKLQLRKLNKKQKIYLFIILVLLYFIFNFFVLPKINYLIFTNKYEKETADILSEHSLELIDVEYEEMDYDHHKNAEPRDRINEYKVIVYIKGEELEGEEMYEVLNSIRATSHQYLLSNKYKLLEDNAYLDGKSNELGFHEVYTILEFENNTRYELQYDSLVLRNEEVAWSKDVKLPADPVDLSPIPDRKPAMTKERAEALRGTGYNGTRPGSTAESIELGAAQVKCSKCGYHSDNGSNSWCDACRQEAKRNGESYR